MTAIRALCAKAQRTHGTTANLCINTTFRIVYCISKEIDFFLHKISYNCCINIFGNTNVRAVCTMSCSECIVYEYITDRSKVFGEFFSTLCLFFAETSVLK